MTDHFNDLLNAFLDDTISDVDESVLFGMMEREPSFREEFVAALRTRQVAPLLGEFAAPPEATTERIFAAAAQSRSTSALGLLRGRSAILSIGAFALLALVFISGVEWGRDASDSQVVVSSSQSHGDLLAREPRSPATPKPTTSSATVVAPIAAPRIVRSSPIGRSDADAGAMQQHSALISRVGSPQPPTHLAIDPPSAVASATNPIPLMRSISPSHMQTSSWQLQVRTIQVMGASAYQVPTNDQTGLNNLAVDALYTITDGLDVGLEVGRQSFLQEYQQTEGGITQLIRQYPALFWAGPAVRYSIQDGIADGLTPYGQIVAGISDGGFIGRALLGIAWRPSADLSLTGGFEAGNLWYSANGAPLSSTHINWSIGMGFTW